MTGETAAEAPPDDSPVTASRLSQVMAMTRHRLELEFGELKAAFSHNTIKGSGGESLVAEFLQKRLPGGVGVTTGQVIDCTGAISRQVDVILYDNRRTPMLFTSPNGHDQLVPAEGVIAVIEVKTHLQKRMLPSVIQNCASVKNLARKAYIQQPINIVTERYGQRWTDAPIYYSLFAASTDAMYAGELNDLQNDIELHNRVDSVCYLNRGANLNVSMPAIMESPIISPTPSEGSGLFDIESEQGLLNWYGAVVSIASQAEVRPIDILEYMPDGRQVSGTMPPGPISKAMEKRMIEEVSQSSGINVDTIDRLYNSAMTKWDAYELLRSPSVSLNPDHEAQVQPLREAAQILEYEEWALKFDVPGLSDD